jgi:hypothetical protein
VQGGQPAQLVGIFFGFQRLAVGNIGTDVAHPFDGGGDDALLLIGEERVVLDHVGHRMARQDGHAVIGLLARELDQVTGGGDLGGGELVVGELGFLQAEYVDRVFFQPFQDLAGGPWELTFQVAIFMGTMRW